MSNITANNEGPVGLGGWLVLPIIGLFVTPVVLVVSIFQEFVPLFTDGTWDLLASPSSSVYNPLVVAIIVITVVILVLTAAYDVVLLVLMFRKSFFLPRNMMIFYAANLVFAFVGMGLSAWAKSNYNVESDGTLRDLFQALVGAAIWIPYFGLSKRVRNTFVKKVVRIDGPDDAPTVEKPYDPDNPYSTMGGKST